MKPSSLIVILASLVAAFVITSPSLKIGAPPPSSPSSSLEAVPVTRRDLIRKHKDVLTIGAVAVAAFLRWNGDLKTSSDPSRPAVPMKQLQRAQNNLNQLLMSPKNVQEFKSLIDALIADCEEIGDVFESEALKEGIIVLKALRAQLEAVMKNEEKKAEDAIEEACREIIKAEEQKLNAAMTRALSQVVSWITGSLASGSGSQ